MTLEDLDAFIVHLDASNEESGTDGDTYFGPYSRDEKFDPEASRERNRRRWEAPMTGSGWRRAWGVYDGDRLIAVGNVVSYEIPAEFHRVSLGMSVLRGHRRQGHGSAVLEAIIAWCREQPGIDWLDLGVFGDNAPAYALYRKFGFQETGRVEDRYRMDGNRVMDISMSLNVGRGS
ncbi:MAG: GNAT family N-acetyltransferase [Gemmatimonadetes bacterium]|nr:GNAT family N-acetyltransferase [Gemmatimonadota bacterium]